MSGPSKLSEEKQKTLYWGRWKPLGCHRCERKYKLPHTNHELEASGDLLCESITESVP